MSTDTRGRTTAKTKRSTGRSSGRSTASGAQRTAEEGAESGFAASSGLSENLQAVLVDLIELALQGKQVHWNVVGTNFRDTHLQLDEIVEAARRFADTVAERMRALHALPDGRTAVVAESTTLAKPSQGEIATTDAIDLMTERLDAVAATCRRVHDDVDEEDPTSADILHEILERIEQLSWMVSAENRTPKRAG
ncbi:DNA starvation/stationary phase protection protein [Microbacterium sp. KUDC0406]|uniref:Dps family protein n=1 Tax=Microbacterium sp. KUDC0406 TaxID=2909588 RepID=UPI001F28EFAA|nr:DNA starvation/stationary phase protection protein [Microbacterium sp. KUDC0406]UJP09635.1 DNA starvation/stationary phase protection protein [Microbacterium sp. KUDC0406]